MEALLVQIEDGRRLEKTAIRSAEFVIGREPGLELSLTNASRVSRRHAAIGIHDDRHTLTDLGSSNGTRVNGHALSETVYLEPGDVIEFAKEVSFVYEQAREPRGGVPIIAISGGGKLPGQGYLEQAQLLGANGVLEKPFVLTALFDVVELLRDEA